MRVEDLYNNRFEHTEKRKLRKFLERYTKKHLGMDESTRLKASPEKCTERFFETFEPFVKTSMNGGISDIEDTEYYKYLLTHLNPKDLLPELTRKGKRHAISKAKDAIGLCQNIRDNGLRDPLDMWKDGDKLILRKGFRRLVILKELGYDEVPVRVWRSEKDFWLRQEGRIPKRWRAICEKG
jgi:hypothetical protein